MSFAIGGPEYPPRLHACLADEAPKQLTLLGNTHLLSGDKRAFICSARCPGRLILAAHDLAQSWRNSQTPVISGFHSPVEREVLQVLAAGSAPLILCLARGLGGMRIKPEWTPLLEAGRLLLLSPFPDDVRRISTKTATFRNRVVAALAREVFIAYAAPGGKTEELARHILAWDTPLSTFDDPANTALLTLGARPVKARD